MGWVVVGGFVALLSITAVRIPPLLVIIALAGATAFVAGLVTVTQTQKEFRTARTRWQQAIEAWKTEQTRLWLQHRSRAELWACPTCGNLTCSNQHSSTTTYRTGRRRYDSYTDPR